MNYEFNLLHHVGEVAKKSVCSGGGDGGGDCGGDGGARRDNNTPSGPTGEG